ncbi:acyl-CoA synthetase [Acetobacter nitrogenifigens DSM 23921 = NBRC 105050]|uniref:Acyl-CoA synthetase n=1 Tax=Acetobacter nitrogenifigens DSM 23921 = NBRC 105050 TaxID=1120919 RepID=A0A511XEF7_9PROT|nr:fatty acyl-AMP ligase [Acetobacter nitrogenifigens]GBQ92430.1 acyl-CoA synthetase [Acetobacter nitrogenifigens DSM 23921 = NBRC 105050]GEN61338.1 acyl-CoA synthetase [Acetobacter nitrogenifigens DSM 23921 = NBRC 105050]
MTVISRVDNASLNLAFQNTSPAPVPSASGQKRRHGDFDTFTAALDYAAEGSAGFNIYSGRGVLLEALPYAALREQAREMALRLLALGLKPGDRVGLIAESDGDFARIFFGCQYAGLVATPMPLPVAFGGREAYVATIRGMIESSDASALVVPDVIGGWTDEIVAGFDLKFGGNPAQLASLPAPMRPLPAVKPEALSYLQFSSGSTRFPKGVCVTQKSGMANARSIARDGLQVREDGDRCVSWLPLYHDMGLVGFFLTPMTCQLTVDLLPTREFARRPHVWLELISRNRGTISYSPSFGYELCARRSGSGDIDLSCWRIAGIGGDMIRPHILEDFGERFASVGFDQRAFVASYGMAEATLAISFAPLGSGIQTDTVDLRRLESEGVAISANDPSLSLRTFMLCGRVLPGHEMEVRGPDGSALPERTVGAIYVRGPSLMSGYFRLPVETAEALSADGWLNTGDLGYMKDGQIVVTGRAKDLIIINGRNIWPQDLEWCAETEIETLRSRDVAVFSIEEDDREKVVALVQCRATTADAREELRDRVASLFRRLHGVDVNVVLVPPHSLPQTSSGKLTRAKAKTMLLSGAFDPRDETADAA